MHGTAIGLIEDALYVLKRKAIGPAEVAALDRLLVAAIHVLEADHAVAQMPEVRKPQEKP